MNDIKHNKKLYIVATDDNHNTPLIFMGGKFVAGACDKVEPLQVFTKKSARLLIAADADYRENVGQAPRPLIMIPLALPSAYRVRPMSQDEQFKRRDTLQEVLRVAPKLYQDMKARASQKDQQHHDFLFATEGASTGNNNEQPVAEPTKNPAP